MAIAGRSQDGRSHVGLLVAGLLGGVFGLFALTFVIASRPGRSPLAAFVALAGYVGPYAAASGFLFALVWPEWWWRWGLILSRGHHFFFQQRLKGKVRA
jgi:hypothetical protein